MLFATFTNFSNEKKQCNDVRIFSLFPSRKILWRERAYLRDTWIYLILISCVVSSSTPRWTDNTQSRTGGSRAARLEAVVVFKSHTARGTAPWIVPGKPVISGWIRSAGMPSPKLIGPHATLVKVYMLIDSWFAFLSWILTEKESWA